MRTATTAPGRGPSRRAVGAPVLAHGDPAGARSAGDGAAGGGGRARRRRGDRRGLPRRTGGSARGRWWRGPGWTLTALATPGHTADHLSFAWAEGGALFSGDHVMGWATTLISPPDGDLGAFRASLGAAAGRGTRRSTIPGTGRRWATRRRSSAHVLAHRAAREAEILAALARGPATVAELVAAIYAASTRRCTGRRGGTCWRT